MHLKAAPVRARNANARTRSHGTGSWAGPRALPSQRTIRRALSAVRGALAPVRRAPVHRAPVRRAELREQEMRIDQRLTSRGLAAAAGRGLTAAAGRGLTAAAGRGLTAATGRGLTAAFLSCGLLAGLAACGSSQAQVTLPKKSHAQLVKD